MAEEIRTHFPYPDGYDAEDKNKQTMNDISDVIKNGSYLFYEFEDCTIEIPLEIDSGETNPGQYTRHISPLFYNRVIDNKNNWGLLDIITEEVPFYYMEPYSVFDEDDVLLSATRDIGINNVPSPLQDNEFWQVWFRDSIGYVKNSMVLDIYNKMRYPYIFENQYLNAKMFNTLSNMLYSNTGDVESRIGFKTTDEENSEVYDSDYKFYGHEIGCLDYMEDIVEKKVNSTYSFIDFNPEYSGFLSDWVESMYGSGQITYEEKKEEYLVYKLQDIRGELLRRKFAGTYSLYMLLMSSIGKTGSYVGVVTAGDINAPVKGYYDEEGNLIGLVKSYNDNRPLRLPNIPGVFTEYNSSLDRLNPISIYYDKPDEMNKIPLGTLIPLFYSSSDVNYISSKYSSGKEGKQYNNELFHKAIDSDLPSDVLPGYVVPKDIYKYESLAPTLGGDSRAIYRTNFYRDSSNLILWDNMPGLLARDSVLRNPDTLDMLVEITEDGLEKLRYRTLDETEIDEVTKRSIYRTLDNFQGKVDLSSVYGSVLDVTADDILYHRNILQKQGDYQFVTYPISNGNGLCLMDTSWLNYLEYYSNQKSKVNEDITFGVQISTYIEVDDRLSVPYEYFTYKIERTEDSNEIEKVKLYHNLIKYNAPAPQGSDTENDFKITSVKSTLMTVIRMKHQGAPSFYEDGVLKSEYKEFEKFTRYNIGLIPFTYRGLTDEAIEGMKLGYDGGISWYDDVETQGFSEAYFTFSETDLPDTRLSNEYDISSGISNNDIVHIYGVDPGNLDASSPDYSTFISRLGFAPVPVSAPTDSLKSVYFTIKRIEEEGVKFSWSEPIRVFPHGILSEGDSFRPDWMGLVYYLNPFLNFTEESASPLRHKPALKAPISKLINTKNTVDTGDDEEYYVLNNSMPSEDTALCNLTRMRHLDYLCGDVIGERTVIVNGESTTESNFSMLPWYKSTHKGLYLSKEDNSLSTSLIFGDNRNTSKDIIYDRIVTIENAQSIPSSFYSNILYYFSKDIKDIVDEEEVILYSSGYYMLGSDNSLKKIFFNPEKERFSDIYRDPLSVPVIHFESKGNDSSISGDSFKLYQVGIGENNVDLSSWAICFHVNNTKSENQNISVCGVSVECPPGDHRISVSQDKMVIDNDAPKSVDTRNFSLNKDLFDGFIGDVYDFRLYNVGRDASELRILNSGMLRELYSYSPSNYKLAHSIYVDNALIRMVDNAADNTTPYGIKKIGALRAFNRSVWDSIIVDMYPISTEEADPNSPQYYEYYKNPIDDSDIYNVYYEGDTVKTYLNDCVEQSLLEDFEVFNGRSFSQDTTLIHNNTSHILSRNSYVSMVLSLIQPISCKDEAIKSMNYLRLNSNYGLISTDSVTIPMKSDSTDDYFKYSADLDINFTVTPETNFSWFMARGSNVSLRYIPSIDDTMAVLDNTTIKGSEKNYILLPLCIPPQDDEISYLDKFSVRNFLLSRTLTSFLRATTYYNEIRIPVPCSLKKEGFKGISVNIASLEGDDLKVVRYAEIHGYDSIYRLGLVNNKYIDYIKITDENEIFQDSYEYFVYDTDKSVNYLYNKWDAIRTLKEGEYIFTCKYPLKILPFTDAEFSGGTKDYNTLYGTMSFKVEVSGTPKEMTDEEILKYSIPEELPKEYGYSEIEATLKSSLNRVNPDDNLTFPHRKMKINLYVYGVKNGVAGKMTSDNSTEDYELDWTLVASNDPNKAFKFIEATSFKEGQTYYKKDSDSNEYSEVISPISEDIDQYFIRVSGSEDGVVYLDKKTLDEGVVIRKNSTMFLSNNYVEAFYVNGYDRSKETSLTIGSEDDDLIDPIIIKGGEDGIFSDDENLLSKLNGNGDEINKITLLAGKSYKILFDYTSNISEFRYRKNKNDSQPVNIKSNDSPSDLSKYVYTESGESGIGAFSHIDDQSFGYYGSTVNGTWSWSSEGEGLGDPYSNGNNSLARYNSNMENAYQIRYLDKLKIKEETPNEDGTYTYELVDPEGFNNIYRYRLNTIQAYDANDSLRSLNISEADIIRYHYDQIFPNSKNSTNVVKDLVSQSCGLIGGFSYINPDILRFSEGNWSLSDKEFLLKLSPKALPNEESKTYTDETSYRLCSYQVPAWRIPYLNSAFIERVSSLSSLNNIITVPLEKFDNNCWTFRPLGLLFNDLSYDDPNVRDSLRVFVRDDISDGHIRFRYNKGTAKVNAVYEISLKLKKGTNMEVLGASGRLYVGNNVVETCTLVATNTDSDGWITYSGSTDDPVIAESVEFDIRVLRSISDLDEVDDYMRFKGASVKWKEARKYRLGLSEAYEEGQPYDKSMIIVSHTMPMFRKTYQKGNKIVETFIPIQFKPNIVSANETYRPIPGAYRAASFIDSCAVEEVSPSSRIRYLKAPWVRRLNLWCQGNKSRAEFHKYSVKKNSLGTLEYREIYSAVNDIYHSDNNVSAVTVIPSDDREKFYINFTGGITMDLNKDKTLKAYNNNLKVYNGNSISLVNERTSYTYNCFDFNRYSQGMNSYVGVTNVQLLGRDLASKNGAYDDREVIYELEYLPIIYDELKNHISFNIMLHHVGGSSDNGTDTSQNGAPDDTSGNDGNEGTDSP